MANSPTAQNSSIYSIVTVTSLFILKELRAHRTGVILLHLRLKSYDTDYKAVLRKN